MRLNKSNIIIALIIIAAIAGVSMGIYSLVGEATNKTVAEAYVELTNGNAIMNATNSVFLEDAVTLRITAAFYCGIISLILSFALIIKIILWSFGITKSENIMDITTFAESKKLVFWIILIVAMLIAGSIGTRFVVELNDPEWMRTLMRVSRNATKKTP